MGVFSNKNNALLPAEKAELVVAAVRQAEAMTSGEIRVFIESHCAYVNAVDRAWEVFERLQMHATKERNAVLVYMALLDRQIAIVGDEGINIKVAEDNFWKKELETLRAYCRQGAIAEGLQRVVLDIGQAIFRIMKMKITTKFQTISFLDTNIISST
jgi:uncharacterized membrane protein